MPPRPTRGDTDWARLAAIYGGSAGSIGLAVVALNRAVASRDASKAGAGPPADRRVAGASTTTTCSIPRGPNFFVAWVGKERRAAAYARALELAPEGARPALPERRLAALA